MKEVLLKENIEHLGYRGEVVTVADGYARNYLLPRNLAMPVTKSNQRQIELAQAAAEKIDASEREEAKTLATRIEGVQCVIARRVGETDTLYGSVTSSDIADYLADRGVEVDKRKIQLPDPIKELGDTPVGIKLRRDVTAQLIVRVVKDVPPGEDSQGDTSADA